MIFNKIKSNPSALHLVRNIYASFARPHSCARHDINTSIKLLDAYLKSGRIGDADKLFEQMPERSWVSYSIMIHGYAKNGFHRRSIELFNRMRVLGFVPKSFTMVGALVGTVGLRDLVLGQCVHGLVVKSGFESNLIVGTCMVDMYAKCRSVVDSLKIFEALDSPNLVSCNVLVSGYIYNELFHEGLSLFNHFRKYGLMPNEVVILSLVQGCVGLSVLSLCESVHCLVVKLGLDSNTCVNNSLLDMYSNLRDIDAATKIFNEMERKDVISWTTMMGLLIGLEHAVDALELFCRMRGNSVGHDAIVHVNLISSCSILGDLLRGKQIHAQAVVSGFGSELPLRNSLIAMYSKCGDLDLSRTMFNLTTNKSLVSWTAMISGYVQNGQPGKALDLFIQFKNEENFFLDSALLVSALTASGELGTLGLCQQLHCHAFEAGFSRYVSVQNTLVSTYSKCGKMELAWDIFREMGDLQSIISWNVIIHGYGINGHGENALALFREMRSRGKEPDSATYQCILSGCSHAGLLDDGLLIFEKMVEEGKVRPTEEHYGCVIDLIARAGHLSDANAFASKHLVGVGRNVWKALLSGCMFHSNVRLAEFAAQRISEQEEGQSDQVVLLSNVYASVGRFQDAEELRLSMQAKGLIKNPGISYCS